ncbi:hypothetical protein OHT93_37355 [Streptomyces sp. NBC_00191]|uniref:hypothetical protein n=1 Tax=Streptomyces sp. NBC_00191 TaxID=2975674 RepID=UPI0032551F2B
MVGQPAAGAAQVALVEGVETAGVGEHDGGHLLARGLLGEVRVHLQWLAFGAGVRLGCVRLRCRIGEFGERLAQGDVDAGVLRSPELDSADGQRTQGAQRRDDGDRAAPAHQAGTPGQRGEDGCRDGEQG